MQMKNVIIGDFPSCFEPYYEGEASYIDFIMKINFIHTLANNTDSHTKSLATLSNVTSQTVHKTLL